MPTITVEVNYTAKEVSNETGLNYKPSFLPSYFVESLELNSMSRVSFLWPLAKVSDTDKNQTWKRNLTKIIQMWEIFQPTKSVTLLKHAYGKPWSWDMEVDAYHQLACRWTNESELRFQWGGFTLQNQTLSKAVFCTKAAFPAVFPRWCFQFIPLGFCTTHTVVWGLFLPSCEMERITGPSHQGHVNHVCSCD